MLLNWRHLLATRSNWQVEALYGQEQYDIIPV